MGWKRARRIAAGTTIGLTLGAAAVAGTAPTAGASPPYDTHFCEEFAPADDGALVDPLHHSLEPLAPALHTTNCYLQVQVDYVACVLPPLRFLRSPSYQFYALVCP